jgi:hypothetical protein
MSTSQPANLPEFALPKESSPFAAIRSRRARGMGRAQWLTVGIVAGMLVLLGIVLVVALKLSQPNRPSKERAKSGAWMQWHDHAKSTDDLASDRLSACRPQPKDARRWRASDTV